MAFEKYFNHEYELYEFPYFVPKEEREYNQEFVRLLLEENWIPRIWKGIAESNKIHANQPEADRIVEHGGLILEICAGPAGGFMPLVLKAKYDSIVMINDLCPSVLREWKKLFDSFENPPKNVEYAAFDVCSIPFMDNSIDVVSGFSAIINIEGGDRRKALGEIYRILKPGGLFVFSDGYVSKDTYDSMSSELQEVFMGSYPNIFCDYQSELEALNYSSIETVNKGSWSNKDDQSTLADFSRKHNIELIFTEYTKYCIK